MNKKSALFLAGIAAILLTVSYFYFGGLNNKEAVSNFPPDLPNPNAPASSPAASGVPADSVAAESTSSGNGFLPTKMEDPKRYELLQKNFKEMSICLNMKLGPFTQNDDMNFETLNTLIAPDLGEVVTTTEEWSATDIKTNSGEIHRIFIQNVPNSDHDSVRTLKYYLMTPGGGQKELPLTKEQSINPTETLIASLEGDGQLVSKSNARKVFYQNGDDLSVVERNGRVYSFELAHDQKNFKCSGVDSSQNLSCSCK